MNYCSPGGNTDESIDSNINHLYDDTDVCVYLLNVNDTAERTDQEFIKKMIEQYDKAELFILVNHCDDLDECSQDEANEVTKK